MAGSAYRACPNYRTGPEKIFHIMCVFSSPLVKKAFKETRMQGLNLSLCHTRILSAQNRRTKNLKLGIIGDYDWGSLFFPKKSNNRIDKIVVVESTLVLQNPPVINNG